MTKLCLNRDCELASLGPHIDHHNTSIHSLQGVMLNRDSHPEINWGLETLKQRYGYHCIQCNRQLIPTDKDHAFCNDCWTANMEKKL